MNRINLFCLLCIFPLFEACYVDKGNYSYTDKLVVKVAGIEDNYTNFILDTVKFRPTITPADREYECFWGISPEGGYQFDTIAKTKDLDYVVHLMPGSYKLRFCAKDVKTNIFVLEEYKFSVVTDMSVGWWILKEVDGKTDIDLFTPQKKKEDVLKSKNGKSLEGKPKNMAYVNKWLYYHEEDKKSTEKESVFIATDRDVAAVDFFSGSILRSFDNLFYNTPAVKKPQNIFFGSNGLFLVNDNKLHVILLVGNGQTGFFGDPQLGSDRVISDCKTTHAYATPLLFDEKSASFFTTNYTSLSLISFRDEPWASSSSDQTPVNNLNAELLYVGIKVDEYAPVNAYALLKSKTEEKYFLKKIAGSYRSPYRNPVLSTRELNNSLGILSAEHRAMAKDYNLMYFSKGNELWAFDVEELREVKQDIVVPAGEKITYMEYLRFAPSFDKTLWFNYVVIGTTQGGKYTLYRHDVVAGKLQPGVKIGEGTGEVARACYLHMNEYIHGTDLL